MIDFCADLGRGYAMRVLQGCVRIEYVMYYFTPCLFTAHCISWNCKKPVLRVAVAHAAPPKLHKRVAETKERNLQYGKTMANRAKTLRQVASQISKHSTLRGIRPRAISQVVCKACRQSIFSTRNAWQRGNASNPKQSAGRWTTMPDTDSLVCWEAGNL